MYLGYATKAIHIAHANARGAIVDASFDLSTPLTGCDADHRSNVARWPLTSHLVCENVEIAGNVEFLCQIKVMVTDLAAG